MPESIVNEAIVIRFNDAIANRDIDILASWLTDDHAFIDTAGGTVTGRDACVEAWRGFFNAFPDYRNIFQSLRTDDDEVIALGYSTCSEAELNGPAIWTARIRNGKIAAWRVYEDTSANRLTLGIGATD